MACNKADTEPVISESVNTIDQQEEMIQDNTVESDDNNNSDNPEQDAEEVKPAEPVATVEPAEPTPTPEPEPVEEPKEIKEEFDVTPLDKIMYAQNAVNLRSGPSTDYETVGSLALNQEVKVIGQASTGWYQIDFYGDTPFVSNNYLGDTMVAVSSNNTTSDNSNNSGGTAQKGVNGLTIDEMKALLGDRLTNVDWDVPMQQDEWGHGDYTGGENYHAY